MGNEIESLKEENCYLEAKIERLEKEENDHHIEIDRLKKQVEMLSHFPKGAKSITVPIEKGRYLKIELIED